MPKAAAKLLLVVLFAVGCQKQPQRILAAPPPTPAAQPAPPAEVLPPPQVDAPSPPAPTLPPVAGTEVPPPPSAPARVKPKRPASARKETPPPVADTPAPAPASAPAPQLGEVISPQRKRRLDADVDRAIHNAQTSLQSLTGKNLSAQQQVAAAQAASFLRQAAEARPQDLASARSLAQRAEVIARDLAKTVK
jgi:hypothetical protein